MPRQLLNTPVKYTPSLIAIADRTWNRVCDLAFNTAWAPFTRLAETAVVALMQNITIGRLRVFTYSHTYTFPHLESQHINSKPDLTSEIRVVNDAFWVRLFAMSDLGFAEAYMNGDVECDDLVPLFHIFLENRENLSNLHSGVSRILTLPHKLTSYRFVNTIATSPSNMSAHYDISNVMFSGFLSEDMTYSCAIFAELDGDVNGGRHGESSGGQNLRRLDQNPSSTGPNDREELHEAQLRKLHHIIHKAQILPGHRVLEIGSGWGSMAILIAQTIPETIVDTITLSEQQQCLARQRVEAAGLMDRVTVHLMDYRNLPAEWEGVFDRVVSIEMMEQVGAEFLDKYWSMVDWAMTKKGGVGVVQVITLPEPRFEQYTREIDFIRKWTLQTGSSGRLIVDSVSNIGPHYARTLREWRRRFLDSFESVIVPALKIEYPDVMCGPRGREEIEGFKRKWIYYYCYCEVGFTTRTLGDHIVTFTREGYQGYGCSMTNL